MTYTCPTCQSPYTFDGTGIATCPSCGQVINHDAPPPQAHPAPPPPVTERVVYVERENQKRTSSIMRLLGVLVFAFLTWLCWAFGFTFGMLLFAALLLLVIVSR